MGTVIGESDAIRPGFIDPRVSPGPPCRVPIPPPASDPEALSELLDLCRAGRIYAVETWIRAGKPISLELGPKRPGRPQQTPLAVAIESGQYDLTVLLLENGYPISTVDDYFFESLLWDRKFAYFDLLVAWGVDILRASPGTILDTYSVALFDRYEVAGGDLARHHALAIMLGDHSSNRPAYGWAKRRSTEPRIARELAVALGIAIRKGNERTVALLLWAGADPHQPAPYVDPESHRRHGRDEAEDEDDECSSALSDAVICGQGKLLARLKPDPTRDDFETLWGQVRDCTSIDILGAIQLPKDWSRALYWNLSRAVSEYSDRNEARRCVERLETAYGARLTSLNGNEVRWLRRSILRSPDEYMSRWALRWLRRKECCEPAIFEDLTRTGVIRQRCAAIHLPGFKPTKKRQE
jgi:hypothetical protein